MKWRDWTGATLDFSRPERVAILLLLGLTVIIYLLPRFFPAAPPAPLTDTAWIAAIRQLEIQEERAEKKGWEDKKYNRYPVRSKTYPGSGTKGKLFYFDPNTLDTDGWRQLGLREKTIQTIQRFREKGGRFREAADLQKIYGLFPDEYERLAPWVQINATDPLPAVTTDRVREKPSYPAKKTYRIIDINLADTSDFIALPGIGSKLAARIVLFREKLGGFYRIEQIAETFGLPDSTFQQIRPFLKMDPPVLRKIRINTATLEEMKAHPYIRSVLARTILAYRTEHGAFLRVEDLKKMASVTEEIYVKLVPYLVAE